MKRIFWTLAILILVVIIYNGDLRRMGGGALASYIDFYSLIIVLLSTAAIVLLLKLVTKNKIKLGKALYIGFIGSGLIGFVYNTAFFMSRNQIHIAYRIAFIPILYGIILSMITLKVNHFYAQKKSNALI